MNTIGYTISNYLNKQLNLIEIKKKLNKIF